MWGGHRDPPRRDFWCWARASFENGSGLSHRLFLCLQTDGIFQNQSEVEAHTQANAAPGDLAL